MQNELEKLEQLIKEAKSVDSKALVVDQEFKESLREELYQNYLNQAVKGGSIMAKIKAIFSNKKLLLLSAGIFMIAVITGSGIYMFTRKTEEGSGQKEVLLAANLAVADGDVEVKKAGEDRWMEAKQGDVLNQGDSLKTGEESRAVLELDNGDAVRLNASSEIDLESMNPQAIVMEQVSGESYNRVASSDENTYTIKAQGIEAQALGTAYTFSSNEAEKQVAVYVYESKVKLNLEDTKIDELSKAIINTEENKVEISEMSEEEYGHEFVSWNREKDKELGLQCHEADGPTVEISEPADGVTTEAESVAVKGTVTAISENYPLRKIKVNGDIYTSKDENGKGFDLADGTFDVDVALNEGENVITVVAYDIYWNSSDEVTVTITRTVPEPPAPENYFYISSISSPSSGKIRVKWVMTGFSAPHGFKVIKADHVNPVYPGDSYKYLSNADVREYTWTGLSSGTYHVRVCIYNGSGGCTRYTQDKAITVEGEVQGETSSVNSITLSGSGANVNWSVDGYSSKGFKIVWSKNSGPTYPTRSGDKYHYRSDPNTTSDTISAFDGVGTYYVRVCEYLGGACGVYSNQITVNL